MSGQFFLTALIGMALLGIVLYLPIAAFRNFWRRDMEFVNFIIGIISLLSLSFALYIVLSGNYGRGMTILSVLITGGIVGFWARAAGDHFLY